MAGQAPRELEGFDRSSRVPLYHQLIELIKRDLATSRLQPGDKLPTEADYCSRYGLSRSTVIQAINHLVHDGLLYRERGSGTYVRRVLPSRQASVRAQSKSIRIGLVSPSLLMSHENPYFTGILAGIPRGIEKENATTILAMQSERESVDYFRLVQRDDIDGFIVFAPREHDRPALRVLARNQIPFVVVGAAFDEPWNSVICDQGQAAEVVVDHLVELGHRRIAIMTSAWESPDSHMRWVGYQKAMQRHGIPSHPHQLSVLSDTESWEIQSIQAVREWLRQTIRPTAIIAGGFELALGAVRAVREADMGLPTDVSIVTFDDFLPVRYFDPPLSAVRQPLTDMGEAAVRDLLAVMRGEVVPPVRRTLAAELLIRGSSGPVPTPTHPL